MNKKIIKAVCITLASVCALSSVMFTGSSALGEEISGVEGDTLYSIGSVSKMYVTTAAMQLVDKGIISLDEPVVTYIPDFKMADERYKDITVRMLMDHTSGIMGSTDSNSFLYEDNDFSAHDNFLTNLEKQRLKAEPGEFSNYCNDGFDLLEILVERVTGQDFTDYMNENIVKSIGGIQTGTYRNAFQNPCQVNIYDKNGQTFAHEYHIGIGAGGVLSTAAELCGFGSTFFKGDNTLLSEKSKDEMAENEASDRYEGNYALGWDDVDVYEAQGVKVVQKGGDLYNQHAMLMVAPEEKISVAVCTSGGGSDSDGLFAKCLMNIALSENGIEISEPENKEYKLTDTVPIEYKEYEGLYVNNEIITDISFPEMKYMKIELCDQDKREVTFCKYSEEGKFVRMLGDVSKGSNVQDSEAALYSFEKRAKGKIYLLKEAAYDYAGLGALKDFSYFAEKLEPGNAGEKAKAAWKERAGKYYFASGKYSNISYHVAPMLEVKVSGTDDGYVYSCGVQKITDETHAKAFINIPGQNGRDLSDITVSDTNGIDQISVDGSEMMFISENSMTELTSDMTEFKFSERDAKWFIIGEDMGGSVVSFNKTEHTSVYVYDKYDKCTYNTYMSGFDNRIPLPTEGKIVFIGEPGENIRISKVQ